MKTWFGARCGLAAMGRSASTTCPPGRYGLKAGHDAYDDPHIPRLTPFGQERPPEERALFRKTAEPWQGAVKVEVKSRATTPDVAIDFRPPAPIVER